MNAKLKLRSLILAITFGTMIMNSCKISVTTSDSDVVLEEDVQNIVLQNILTRSSVRKYKNKEVEPEKIELMLKAGMAAPSGMNKQPWSFVLIEDKDVLNKMAEGLPYAKMLSGAPMAIVVCGDPEISRYWYLDCSAATQNILLAAHSMELGAVWTAAYPYDDRMDIVRENTGIGENIMPLCVIPIGYPEGKQNVKDKWKPEKIRHIK